MASLATPIEARILDSEVAKSAVTPYPMIPTQDEHANHRVSWVSNGTGSEKPRYPWRPVAHLTPHASARIYVECKFHHNAPFRQQPPPFPCNFNHGKGPILGKTKKTIGMDFCAIFDHPQPLLPKNLVQQTILELELKPSLSSFSHL